jgi:NADP-dependent 3-hydroxy acid dehydrogenase YdfG
MISPGAVSSEILEGISDAATAAAMKRTWDTAALQPGAVARAILYAIEQPVDVDVNEIVLRPVGQGF